MPGLDAVIFDFDGTLADVPLDFTLMKTKIAALGEVFLGQRPEPDATPALEWLARLTDRIAATNAAEAREFNTRARLAIAAMELDAARTGHLFAFTRPVLALLRERGVATGIVTRNISAAVRTVFPDVDTYIDVLVPREEVPVVKPHPDHLLRALHRLHARPERSLMVGDHPMDVQTGLNAGTRTAGVTTGRMPADAFVPLHPDYLVPDVGQLIDRLQSDGLL